MSVSNWPKDGHSGFKRQLHCLKRIWHVTKMLAGGYISIHSFNVILFCEFKFTKYGSGSNLSEECNPDPR